MTLTVKQIEAAKHGVQKERLSDGNGLYLRLHPSGKKVFQVQIANSPKERRRVWVSVGDFPGVGLKEARDITGWARLQVSRGWSADQLRGALNLGATPPPTSTPATLASLEDKSRIQFHDVASVWFDRKRKGLKNGKHIQQNWNTVATYALPTLGHREVASISRSDVVEALRPIWHGKHETARRTLARIGEIFELAKLEYGVDTNPADFDPTIAYGRARRVRDHFGALPHDRIGEFWTWLEHARCDELTRQFVMLLVLSAKRTGEVRFVEWSHLALSTQTWTTPATLMKMGREHRVPLSHQAMAVIGNAKILSGGEPHLFSKPRNGSRVICENAALNLVKRFDPAITGHGFRATFKTWARLQRCYEKDAIGLALAHRLPPLEEAYLREDFFDERRALMRGQFLAFIAEQPGCVVAMEACATAHGWGREFEKLGHDVRLIPPIYVKPFVKRQKDDAADAEAIVEAALRPTTRFVALKSEAQQARAMLFRTRQMFVGQRTQMINALRGHLAEHGEVAARGMAQLKRLADAIQDQDIALADDVRELGQVYLEQIKGLNGRVAELDGKMRRASKEPTWRGELRPCRA